MAADPVDLDLAHKLEVFLTKNGYCYVNLCYFMLFYLKFYGFFSLLPEVTKSHSLHSICIFLDETTTFLTVSGAIEFQDTHVRRPKKMLFWEKHLPNSIKLRVPC